MADISRNELGSFLAAFSDFLNSEAILIKCVYCPKHTETKAGNGWIPVSLCLCVQHITPIVNTDALQNPETKKYTRRRTKVISAD